MNNTIASQSTSVHSTTDQSVHTQRKESMTNAITLGVVGVVAAAIAYVAIQQTGKVFELPPALLDLKLSEGRNQSPEVMKLFYEGLVALDYKHAALWMGIAGSIIGVLFGLTLGMMRRSSSSLFTGALGGLLVGCALSVCGGLVANFIGENVVTPVRKDKIDVPPHYAMLLHGATWLVVGLGIGLGTGLGKTHNRLRFALGSMFMGAVAGAAAGTFYPFVASISMPFVDPSLTIPEGELNRLVWLGLPSAFIGLTLGRRG